MVGETVVMPDLFLAAGLPVGEVKRWQAGEPALPAPGGGRPETLEADRRAAGRFFAEGDALLRRLPAKPDRTAAEQRAAEALLDALRSGRERFLRAYAEPIYARLTDDYRRFVRATDLVYAAAERFPGLVPNRAAVERERQLLQKDKDGVEIDQGLFFCHLLSHRAAGLH